MLFTARFAASAVALILIALYYLLASIPFSYYHFLAVPQLWWLPHFITWHPLLFAVAVAAIVPRPRTVPAHLRPWIRYVALAGASTTLCMAVIEAVPTLQSFEVAAALAFMPLLLLLAAAAIVAVAGRGAAADAESAAADGPSVARGALAGFLVGVAYTAASAERGTAITIGRTEFAAASALSIAAHVACFAVAALVVVLVRSWSRRVDPRRNVERLALAVCAAAAVGVVIRRSLLTTLILSDWRAAAISALLAAAIVASVLAVQTRHASRVRRFNGDLWPLVGLGALLIVLIVVLPPLVLLADWGGALQKVIAVTAWIASIRLIRRADIGRRRVTAMAAALSAVAVAGASTAVIAARTVNARASGEDQRLSLGVAIDRYATFDASLGVLLDVFHPMVSDGRFFATLRASGDAIDDRSLAAVPLTIADVQRRPAARPPHLFIVVVDSMRPDYLSAYNPAATFTPAIGAFAKESIVMRRAFTQYAGTALSQPALWAGGLIQRAMYVKPFAAVNNLERLTVAGGYHRYISVDPPLGAILENWSGVTRLDTHLAHLDRVDEMFKFDLCRTVPELIDRLDRDGTGQPVFFYSQPQNLHIRVIADQASQRTERVTVSGTSFFKPAVDALTLIDGCFGRLITDLKRRGIYDDSIVVLTSDHGDSYGEAGRWGHAWWIAPEILRIPLIVHVPQKYLQSREVNLDEIALLTDLTPTLYDVLGYQPVETAGIAGRSFLPLAAHRIAPRDMVLVQSSYSRLYGLLDANARWLYVGDTNHDRELFFDIEAGDEFGRQVDKAEQPKYRRWLLERMTRLEQFYAPGAQH